MHDYIIAIILIPVYILLALLGRRFLKFAHGYEKGLEDAEKIRKMEEKRLLDEIRAEIKEWYWQADKQELAKDPCVVDAMIDLFIRTIDKYKAESEK